MILCSKRVFLNVLTQLWTRDLLLNANYFILDQPGKTAERVSFNDENNVQISSGALTATSKYNIKHSTVLNPQVYKTSLISNTQKNFRTDEERVYDTVISNLNRDSTKSEVYRELFTNPLKGNNIQVCIYLNDDNVIEFGNIICQYLSYNFGCDIIFLDAMCRRTVYGQGYYPGNKFNGKRLSEYLPDYNLIADFSKNISSTKVFSASNLTVWLNYRDWNTLMRLYNLLFPNEPLPPGEYTEEMLRDIIRVKATEGAADYDKNSDIGNILFSTTDVFADILQEYDEDESAFLDKYAEMDLEEMFS